MGTYVLHEGKNYYECSPFHPLVCEMCDRKEQFHVSYVLLPQKQQGAYHLSKNKKKKINLFGIGNESEGQLCSQKEFYMPTFFSSDLPFFALPVLFHSFIALKKP
jgi:hypothetical protein